MPGDEKTLSFCLQLLYTRTRFGYFIFFKIIVLREGYTAGDEGICCRQRDIKCQKKKKNGKKLRKDQDIPRNGSHHTKRLNTLPTNRETETAQTIRRKEETTRRQDQQPIMNNNKINKITPTTRAD